MRNCCVSLELDNICLVWIFEDGQQSVFLMCCACRSSVRGGTIKDRLFRLWSSLIPLLFIIVMKLICLSDVSLELRHTHVSVYNSGTLFGKFTETCYLWWRSFFIGCKLKPCWHFISQCSLSALHKRLHLFKAAVKTLSDPCLDTQRLWKDQQIWCYEMILFTPNYRIFIKHCIILSNISPWWNMFVHS